MCLSYRIVGLGEEVGGDGVMQRGWCMFPDKMSNLFLLILFRQEKITVDFNFYLVQILAAIPS